MNKQLSLLLIFMLVLCSFCFAVPPVTTLQSDNGYTIETTPYQYVKVNSDFRAYFHVFNNSDGLKLTNTTVSCGLILSYLNGSIMYENTSISYTGDSFNIVIDKSYFKEGKYYWFTECNSSGYGGFVGAEYYVTNDGFDNTPNANASLSIIYFMLFMILGIFLIGFFAKFNTANAIVDLCIRRGCFVVGIMLSMYTVSLLLNIVTYANLDILSHEMIFLMTYIGWAGYIASVYLVIQSLFDILNLRKKMRKDRDERIDY